MTVERLMRMLRKCQPWARVLLALDPDERAVFTTSGVIVRGNVVHECEEEKE